MTTYDQLERELHEALPQLYDPDYQPSEALCQAVGCDPEDGVPAVGAAVRRAIEGLKPGPDVPPTAQIRQIYDLLYHRFVLKLTQGETAYRINVSRRTINRLQPVAVRALAAVLWLRGQSSARAKEAVSRQVYGPTGAQAADWWSQVQRELDSLEARAPGAMADVGETISDALDLVNALGAEIGIHVESRFVQPGLVAAAHPVLLQQVLISSMKRLAPHLVDGRIASYARLEDGKATITLAGAIGPAWELTETELIAGIPTSKDISIEARLDGAQLFVWIRTPSADRVTVLVVDDNEDMARFYRDCTLGTSYHVVHITQGRDLSQAIEAAAPDIVVLDVMLPDIDGWRLLMRLRQDSKTRSIPVVICSVVQEEDLARSLGAAAYLPKPVSPRDFVETLDQVLLRARAAALRDSARSA